MLDKDACVQLPVANRAPAGLNEVGALELVLVRTPQQAVLNQSRLDEQWRALNYSAVPDYAKAVEEHRALVHILEQAGAEVLALDSSNELGIDSIYVRDAGVLTPCGVTQCAMGKLAREAEPGVMAARVAPLGVPLNGAINGAGRLEGGDLVWFDSQTVAVGRGYRTNLEGIQQFQALVGESVTVEVIPLPHWRGRQDVFHLMSMLSPVDYDTMLVYSPLLPVPFREWMLERGYRLIEVPDEEFDLMGCNVLALAPAHVLMLSGRPATRKRLESAGIAVQVYDGAEISVKGEGGPTCLTRPIRRASR